MKALVVFESMFGNTEAVARSISEGLAAALQVEIVAASTRPRPQPAEFDLLVIGGPTHAFSMSRPSTRADAVAKGSRWSPDEGGVREWLAQLTPGPHTTPVATFDTREDSVRHLPGSAARKATKVLRKLGYEVAAEPTSFYVEGLDGPLLAGELDRARAWGAQLGAWCSNVGAHAG